MLGEDICRLCGLVGLVLGYVTRFLESISCVGADPLARNPMRIMRVHSSI